MGWCEKMICHLSELSENDLAVGNKCVSLQKS